MRNAHLHMLSCMIYAYVPNPFLRLNKSTLAILFLPSLLPSRLSSGVNRHRRFAGPRARFIPGQGLGKIEFEPLGRCSAPKTRRQTHGQRAGACGTRLGQRCFYAPLFGVHTLFGSECPRNVCSSFGDQDAGKAAGTLIITNTGGGFGLLVESDSRGQVAHNPPAVS